MDSAVDKAVVRLRAQSVEISASAASCGVVATFGGKGWVVGGRSAAVPAYSVTAVTITLRLALIACWRQAIARQPVRVPLTRLAIRRREGGQPR